MEGEGEGEVNVGVFEKVSVFGWGGKGRGSKCGGGELPLHISKSAPPKMEGLGGEVNKTKLNFVSSHKYPFSLLFFYYFFIITRRALLTINKIIFFLFLYFNITIYFPSPPTKHNGSKYIYFP